MALTTDLGIQSLPEIKVQKETLFSLSEDFIAVLNKVYKCQILQIEDNSFDNDHCRINSENGCWNCPYHVLPESAWSLLGDAAKEIIDQQSGKERACDS